MDIIRELNSIQNWVEENLISSITYEITIYDNTVKLQLEAWVGWNMLERHEHNWDACDFKTNIENAEKFVRNFDYKNLDTKHNIKGSKE